MAGLARNAPKGDAREDSTPARRDVCDRPARRPDVSAFGGREPGPGPATHTPRRQEGERDRGHHHGEGWGDQTRVLRGGRAQDGGELRDAREEGLLRWP